MLWKIRITILFEGFTLSTVVCKLSAKIDNNHISQTWDHIKTLRYKRDFCGLFGGLSRETGLGWILQNVNHFIAPLVHLMYVL